SMALPPIPKTYYHLSGGVFAPGDVSETFQVRSHRLPRGVAPERGPSLRSESVPSTTLTGMHLSRGAGRRGSKLSGPFSSNVPRAAPRTSPKSSKRCDAPSCRFSNRGPSFPASSFLATHDPAAEEAASHSIYDQR